MRTKTPAPIKAAFFTMFQQIHCSTVLWGVSTMITHVCEFLGGLTVAGKKVGGHQTISLSFGHPLRRESHRLQVFDCANTPGLSVLMRQSGFSASPCRHGAVQTFKEPRENWHDARDSRCGLHAGIASFPALGVPQLGRSRIPDFSATVN